MVAARGDKVPTKGAVLYIDHARHLSPLSLTYHATASRQLTSGRSDVIPPSTSVETETAYCPRCLTFCDAGSASTTLGVCQKETGGCKDCPLCFSPVSVSIDKESGASAETSLFCHYVCGHCLWSSQQCGVSVSANKLLEYSGSDITDQQGIEKKRLTAISEITMELESCFQRNVAERNQKGDDLFLSITEMWAKKEVDEERKRRLMIGSTIVNDEKRKDKSAWSLKELEDSLADKRRGLQSQYIGVGEERGKGIDEKSSNSVGDDKQTKYQLIPTSQQLAAQMSLSAIAPRYQKDLLPLPVHYRTRVSRRCRAEQSAGRTGILMKPQLNPLTGDTSLRVGHGQWWKKDSTAVHVVPRVQVCNSCIGQSSGNIAALLKVNNPTLSMIRLRFAGPNVLEERAHIEENELENILIDPFTETTVDKAGLCSLDSLQSISPTDWIELDSAEDLLLDIGKRQDDDPKAVRSWGFASVLDASETDYPELKIVASRGDTSWVELTLPHAAVVDGIEHKNIETSYVAVPLSLHIEVGRGSWDGSLIKRLDLSEQEQDLVQIDFVALLHVETK